jgi:transposase
MPLLCQSRIEGLFLRRPFEKLADTLLKHLTGILNYCDTKVQFGVVEAVDGNAC